jgi:hypothetical protein
MGKHQQGVGMSDLEEQTKQLEALRQQAEDILMQDLWNHIKCIYEIMKKLRRSREQLKRD